MMQFTYLGTAAAEGWPAVFCNCPFCKEAARLGGKNIRTRSQALINDDLLIDLPPDTYMHKLHQGLDLSAVKYLFITHKHMDHFYPQELTVYGGVYSHEMVSETLDVFCAQETKDFFFEVSGWELEEEGRNNIRWHILHPFETVQAGPYRVTPLPASHMQEGNEPFIYHIRDDEGRSVLYLHDSGYYKDEVWDYFEKSAKSEGPVSMVSFDSTSGYKQTDHRAHMGFAEVFRVKKRMEELGLIGPQTVSVMNHFSHNGQWLYDEMVEHAAPQGCLVSYDGMKLEV